jgi:hypothetical protein
MEVIMRIHKVLNVLITVVLFLTLLPFSTKAAETPSVNVVASKTNPAVGEDVTFSINLKNFIAPSNNLSSFEVKVNYDSTFWDTASDKVEFSDYIKSLQPSQYEMPVNSISNGTVHFALSIYKNDQVTYFSGDGTLFSFKLKPKKNGLTDVNIGKSLFVQIDKPGINVAHGKGNANLNIGGETAPPPPPIVPPIDPGTGGNPYPEVIPVMPAEVDRTQTTTEDGQTKETIGFNGDKAKQTIERAKNSKSVAVEIKVNDKTKEADFISFSTSSETITQLVSNNLYLIITSDKGQMELSVDTLKTLKGNVTIDLFLLTDPKKKEATNQLINENVKNGRSVGMPTEIATNFSGKTKITLPLIAEQLPKDAEALTDYLKTLGVFVQHSDGSLEFLKGVIQYDKDGKAVAISIMVEKFSTFTVISDKYAKQAYVDDEEISSYAYESVYKAQQLGIMSGVNGKFSPAQNVTRAQFTKMIVEMLGEEPASTSSKSFKDVSSDYWAYGYIMKAVELGIIKGVTPDTFKPGATITREQVALMLGRAYKLKASSTPVEFQDQNKIQEEAVPYVQALQEKGVITGNKGNFNPKQNVTREMAAVISVRMIESIK